MLSSCLLLLGAGCNSAVKLNTEPTPPVSLQKEANIQIPEAGGAPHEEDPFDLTKKVPGTKIFESKKLGIKFTYTPDLLGSEIDHQKIKVREAGNKVYVFFGPDSNMTLNPFSAQSIEMFKKDPNMSLEDAIKQKFFTSKTSKDCMVKLSEVYSTDVNNPSPRLSWPDAMYADIVIPGFEQISLDDPRMGDLEACAPGYAMRNSLQFFFMNKNFPDRFYFMNFGQESISTDGIPADSKGAFYDWYHSLRIQK